ncbi:T9SS type A sorting domain-containing protein [Marinilabilia sp.]
MGTIKFFLAFALALSLSYSPAQTVVKMDMPLQADQPLKVVALFDEEIPEGIPVVLGLMGYDVEGGITPYQYEWMLNGEIVSTSDVMIFTPKKGDDLSLNVIDDNKCRATTSFNLKVASLRQDPNTDGIEGINIYPTVVQNFIHVAFERIPGKHALVRIFDMQGKLIHLESTPHSSRLNVNLSAGTYFVSVKIGDLHKVEKILAK